MTALQELEVTLSEAGNGLSSLREENRILRMRIKALHDLVEMRSVQVAEYKQLYLEAIAKLEKKEATE